MSGEGRDPRDVKLPPSGLAEEILAALREGRDPEPVGPPGERPADASEPAATPPLPVAGSGLLLRFADSLRRAQAEEEEVEKLETWVMFRLQGGAYALPVTEVTEVVRVGEVTRVPNAPFPVIGVFNLRGRVLPLLDLGLRFGLGAARPGPDSRILVLESGGHRMGLLVDAAERILHLAPSRFETPNEEDEKLGAVVARYRQEDLPLRLLDGEALLSVEGEPAPQQPD